MSEKRNGISVAVTTCNGEAYIAAQLDSILNQDMHVDEIIVCDDVSTDNTLKILRQYENRGRIRVYANEQRLGITNNFRKAAGLCEAENYIAFSDQDDVWLPQKLRKNYSAMQRVDNDDIPALVYSDLSLRNYQLEVIHPSFQDVLNVDASREDISTLLFGNIITGCTVMINGAMRRIFCDIPDDKRIAMHDAWLGLVAYSFGRHAFIDEALVLYRQHGNNVTYETNKRNTFIKRIQQSLSQLSSNDDYLKGEIEQAMLFKQLYKTSLSPEQLQVIDDFTMLSSASFIRKKYSSILARRYRYLNRNK